MQGTQEQVKPGAKANRLAREKSPYLLQHQHNPVDWYPWGDEAFARARAEGKPIFLSIGYSTCHWCHVMERESFENDTIASFLNEHFISIKVDREERPDVDRIYMSFVQATTGQGGWPMSVFLTPDLKPFFGGTYFPPDSRFGRPGFLQLLKHIQEVWSSRREEVMVSANGIHERLKEFGLQAGEGGTGAFDPELVKRAGSLLKRTYDPRHGGFGGPPKFPHPSQPQLLLRYAVRFKDDDAIRMVLYTCDRMAAGGIHDQLGGGFSRYSVDGEWLVPHFEKMLYDNAQLTQLYLDGYLLSGDVRHAETVRDILDYVLRDMTHPEGGFFSAEDADSEGHEGRFYCWTLTELESLLSTEEFKVARRYFGLTDQGNFADHSHPHPLPNQNVLSVVDPDLSEADRKTLSRAKHKMIEARSKRVRPHRDDKILVSWNGLMLGAFARAGVVLAEPKYVAAAERAADFIHRTLWDAAADALYHRWRDGQQDNVELLQGYAFLLSGMLDLYEATILPRHLEWAVSLADAMVARFHDPAGGFWQSPAGARDLILRVKDDYDGAEPAGNSVAILSLLRLAKITGREDLQAKAVGSLQFFSKRLTELPQALPHMLQAIDFSLQEPRRALVSGAPEDPRTLSLLHAVHSTYAPNRVVLGTSGPVEPFARTFPKPNDCQVYVCRGTECLPPSVEPAEIQRFLRD